MSERVSECEYCSAQHKLIGRLCWWMSMIETLQDHYFIDLKHTFHRKQITPRAQNIWSMHEGAVDNLK